MTTKQSEEYFFHQCCEKMATNTVIAFLDFDWLLTVHHMIIQLSLLTVLFQRDKIHFIPLNSPF